MSNYKYIYGDVSDTAVNESMKKFVDAAKNSPPESLIATMLVAIYGLSNTKQEALDMFNTLAKGLTDNGNKS